jgi:hypothetical protein
MSSPLFLEFLKQRFRGISEMRCVRESTSWTHTSAYCRLSAQFAIAIVRKQCPNLERSVDHNAASVPSKPTTGKKSRTGRPLLPETALTFQFVDTQMSGDDYLEMKRAAIRTAIDEYNAFVRFRRELRKLSAMVAA